MENIKVVASKKDLSVSITVDLDGKILEIYGELEKYKSGRGTEYDFNTSWFSDDEAKEFYNENWEAIEKLIQSKL